EGEDAVQALNGRKPLLFVEMHDDFAVALRAERVTAGLQSASELDVVVDLPVHDEDDRSVLIRQRLVPAGDIDDRQAAESECDPIIDVEPVIIRSAVDHGRSHALHSGAIGSAEHPSDAAHWCVRAPASPWSFVLGPWSVLCPLSLVLCSSLVLGPRT